MKDIQVRVYRPVAMPDKFFGVPALVGLLNFIWWIFVLVGMGIFYFPFPPLAIILLVICHATLMIWGGREPHMSSLIQTGRRSRFSARTMGRKSRQHTFLP